MKNMGKATTYISRSAKAVYRSLYNALKMVYDRALDPVKFEELKEIAHGERGRETDRMLEEYRKKRQTSEQYGVPVEYLKEE